MEHILPRFFNHSRKIAVIAKDIYVFDENNKKYLDGSSNVLNVNLGYSQLEIINEIHKQSDKLIYMHNSIMLSEAQEKLSDQLIELLGMKNFSCYFCSSGSEAIEAALRISQLVKKNKTKKHASFNNSYHGSTMGALSISGSVVRNDFIDTLFDTTFFEYPFCFSCEKYKHCDYSCLNEIEKEISKENYYSLTFDPVGSNALGSNIMKSQYLSRLSEICRKSQTLLILDEISASIGRTGYNFSFQSYDDFKPDILCISKGLGVGYANIAAVIVNNDVIDNLKNDWNILGNTYNGHPIACAAASKAIEIIKRENLINSNRELGIKINNWFEIIRQNPIVLDVQGIGLFFTIRFKDKNGTLNAKKVNELNKKNGLLMLDSSIVRENQYYSHLTFTPPFISKENEIKEMIEIIQKSIFELSLEVL